MALTTAEKERIRYHLGYLAVQPAASIQYGLPRPIQTIFLVETAMNNVMAEAEPRIRRIVGVMDGVEDQLIDAQARLAAEKVDELTLRKDETEMLEGEYVRWGCRLADMLGCPIYPYSQRYRQHMGVAAGNVAVRG